MATDRPRAPARLSGRWPALLLAIAVNLVFIGVLFFSVRWQSRQPVPVTAELYGPPKATVAEAPAPPAPAPPPRWMGDHCCNAVAQLPPGGSEWNRAMR